MAHIFQPARKELHDQIKRHAAIVRGRVLDVGAGSVGRYRNLFDCSEYVRLDRESTANVDVVGSPDAIPFPDGSFDSIVCTQVIGDIYDVQKAFLEFYRVLKPGGRILLTEALFDSMHDDPYDYWRFTRNSFRRLAEDAGFAVDAIEERGGYWSVRAQMLIRYLINRFDLYHRWYWRACDILAQLYARPLMWLDRHDGSEAARAFSHGFILIASKK